VARETGKPQKVRQRKGKRQEKNNEAEKIGSKVKREMNAAQFAIDTSHSEVTRLRRLLKRKSSTQIQSSDELSLIKATALAWFNNHRKSLAMVIGESAIREIDEFYRELLELADRNPSRRRCDALLKETRRWLSGARAETVITSTRAGTEKTTEQAPDFSGLISDGVMQGILVERWRECGSCIAAGAPLAATVMMGGLLEGLLLARIHREADKTKIFAAVAAPKDKKTGKAHALNEWTLKNYIDVAHELKWISRPVRDLGSVLRDYRNYIHPEKQRAHGLAVRTEDVSMFWEIAKGICRQLISGSP
jgi:hypothetical protein